MPFHYSDPRRADDPRALPDIETFFVGRDPELDTGWYYWSCLPGCLPDGDPIGPFASEAEALTDARDELEEFFQRRTLRN